MFAVWYVVCIQLMCVIFIGQNLSFEPQLEKAWDELQEKVCVLCVCVPIHKCVLCVCIHVYVCMHAWV